MGEAAIFTEGRNVGVIISSSLEEMATTIRVRCRDLTSGKSEFSPLRFFYFHSIIPMNIFAYLYPGIKFILIFTIFILPNLLFHPSLKAIYSRLASMKRLLSLFSVFSGKTVGELMFRQEDKFVSFFSCCFPYFGENFCLLPKCAIIFSFFYIHHFMNNFFILYLFFFFISRNEIYKLEFEQWYFGTCIIKEIK